MGKIFSGVIFIKKYELNLSSVTRRFSAISGLSGEELSDFGDIVMSAKIQVEQMITKEPTAEDYALCEYCAGCIANYNYVCCLLSKPTKVVTANGLYTTSKADVELLEAALTLKNNAVKQISHLTKDNDFVFIQA